MELNNIGNSATIENPGSENNKGQINTTSKIGKTDGGFRRTRTRQDDSFPSRWAFIVLGAGCLLYYCVFLIDNILPEVVTTREAAENPNLFSGETSMKILQKFTNIGQRVVGSPENEEQTPAMIKSEIEAIKLKADPSQTIEYELQKGEGSRGSRHYQNIQNVIAILEGNSGQHGILINCHYDSVPSSVGASDDGINCAVMLELLRVLSSSKIRLRHNVVFLFNGAEEVGLIGSHLSLKHVWVSNADVFLNLDAAGLGGRSILFQSGPKNGWLMRYYSRNAPHPHGQVLGEELFQNGRIPSDTDFEIFSADGFMPGLDFAFIRNGYVYHTKYDKEEYIPGGSHQHMGDNLLAVIRALGNAEELENIEAHSEGTMVYFDYLGWFMVSYSFGAGIAINIIVFLFAILSIVVFIGRIIKWHHSPRSMAALGRVRNSKLYRSHQELMTRFKRNVRLSRVCSSENGNIYYEYLPEMNAKNLNSLKRYQDPTLMNAYPMENFDKDNSNAQSDVTTPIDIDDGTVVKNSPSLRTIVRELALAVGVRFFASIYATGLCYLMACFVDGVAPLSMPYYSNILLIFPFYWCPGLIGYALLPMLYDICREKTHPMTLPTRCQLNLVASHCLWTIFLFIFTCASVRSSVLIMVPVLFTTLALLCLFLSKLHKTECAWVWVYLLIHLPALLLQMYIVLLLYSLFIPITGRQGPIHGDYNVAVFTGVAVIYVTSSVIPLMTLVRKPWMVLSILFGFTLLMLTIALPTSFGFPYGKGPANPSPQRIHVSHIERKFYNESGGLFQNDWGYQVKNSDINSCKTIPDHYRDEMVNMRSSCSDGMEFYCSSGLSSSGYWIKSNGPPTQPVSAELILNEKHWTSEKCFYEFTIKGPDRMDFAFAPRGGVAFNYCNFPLSSSRPDADGKIVRSLQIVRGENTKDVSLRLELNITNGAIHLPLVDVILCGQNVHHEDSYSEAFKAFLADLPDYGAVSSDIGSCLSFVY